MMNRRISIVVSMILITLLFVLSALAKMCEGDKTNQNYEGPRYVSVFSTEVYVRVEAEEETTSYSEETIEPTKITLTGTVGVLNVGMAEVVENITESMAITCMWDNTIKLTQSELELLYTTVYCEAGDQELEAQIMVAQTILNRMLSDKYPDTLRGVVYQRNTEGKPQFAVINWPDFESRGWSDNTKAAVHYALAYRAYPLDMLYFRDSYYHNFGQPYKNVGDMYFSTVEV